MIIELSDEQLIKLTELTGGYKMTTEEAIQIMKKWYKMGNDGLITDLTEEERDTVLEQLEKIKES